MSMRFIHCSLNWRRKVCSFDNSIGVWACNLCSIHIFIGKILLLYLLVFFNLFFDHCFIIRNSIIFFLIQSREVELLLLLESRKQNVRCCWWGFISSSLQMLFEKFMFFVVIYPFFSLEHWLCFLQNFQHLLKMRENIILYYFDWFAQVPSSFSNNLETHE